MSASLFYQPVKGKSLNVGAPSSFMAAIDRAFGGAGPWIFGSSDVDVLRGLAAGFSDDESRRAVEKLIDAIGDGETAIRLWAEY